MQHQTINHKGVPEKQKTQTVSVPGSKTSFSPMPARETQQNQNVLEETTSVLAAGDKSQKLVSASSEMPAQVTQSVEVTEMPAKGTHDVEVCEDVAFASGQDEVSETAASKLTNDDDKAVIG